MKILFAVNNEKISESIAKKYQQTYKKIITTKNVYYFNAIIKELQNDRSYDRIVISEDVESFSNENFEEIDNKIFEKLDVISDEASNTIGDDIPIILICNDRREKSNELITKIFGIGIYSALIGQDRSVQKVCELINRPRTKKEAKVYYKLDSGNVSYKKKVEVGIDETEIQNIMAHFRRVGKDVPKCVESFKKLETQYTPEHLRTIVQILPQETKKILEANSSEYLRYIPQKDKISYRTKIKNVNLDNEDSETKRGYIEKSILNSKTDKTVIIPSKVNLQNVKKYGVDQVNSDAVDKFEILENEDDDFEFELPEVEEVAEIEVDNEINEEVNQKQINNQEKRGRGRPRKTPENIEVELEKPKKGRGRPRKTVEEVVNSNKTEKVDNFKIGNDDELLDFGVEDIDATMDFEVEQPNDSIFNFDMEEANIKKEVKENVLPGIDNDDKVNIIESDDEVNMLPGFGTEDEEIDLSSDEDDDDDELIDLPVEEDFPEFEDNYEIEEPKNTQKSFKKIGKNSNKDIEEGIKNKNYNFSNIPKIEDENELEEPIVVNLDKDEGNDFITSMTQNEEVNNDLIDVQSKNQISNMDNIIIGNKKLAAFVGTSKNGTSFLVNNIAELLSNKKVKTAILDLTQNKNSYYIFTENDEKLREKANKSIENLKNGVAQGLTVNENLDIYTCLPGEDEILNDYKSILKTLVDNYSLILLDCDFNVNYQYFKMAQEIYLVQSQDILTIQPLTAFLRELKFKNILEPSKLRIVLNKCIKVNGLSDKVLVGGISTYNDPGMTYMTELFDRNTIKYVSIPFDIQAYSKYLEGLVKCQISIKEYSKNFINNLEELADMVYPLIGSKSKMQEKEYGKYNNNFSTETNDTLNKMKNRY